MERTNRRKLAVSVLVLGVAALAVDRFVLGPGESGPASVVAGTIEPSQAPAKTAAAPQRRIESSLAERLKAIAVDLDRAEHSNSPTCGPPVFSDAFAVPVAWQPAPESESPESHPNVAAADPSKPELKLTSISSSMAVINGQGLKVGGSGTIGEGKAQVTFTLVSIDTQGRTVVVEVQGRPLTLELPGPTGSK